MASTKVEVWVVVDANGDYAVGGDREDALERYAEQIGALEDSGGYRCYQVTLDVPVPQVVEVTAAIPEESGEARVWTHG